LLESLPPQSAQVLCLDADWHLVEAESEANPQVEVSVDNVAYLIYTSGSTGRPKAVMTSHRAIVNFCYAAARLYGLSSSDRVLQFASLSFDASAEEIYPALASGATVVLRTQAMLASAAQFFAQCEEWGVTVLDLPTAYWHHLIPQLAPEDERTVQQSNEHTAQQAQEQVRVPECVRLLIIGGEKAQPEQVSRWLKVVGERVRLMNTYGPTEATVVATACQLSGRAGTGAEAPIGRPLDNVRLYVLDGKGEVAPLGVAGELYIGGDGLARGYLGRAELTAERFVPDALSGEAGARLYRTGDVVRYLRDGEVAYVGRVDEQVKVRGYRMELGEVEAALGAHEMVREALVVVREDVPGNQQLVAYVVLSGEEQRTMAGELRAFLKERLPDYMIPSLFVRLSELPLTTHGKVDRQALPAPDLAHVASAATYVAPRDVLEHQLSLIWQELLGLPEISVTADFFELGGHSLLAIRLLALIQRELGRKLPLVTLFQATTIASLADVLREQAEDEWSPLVAIQPQGHKPPLFFTHPVGGDVLCYRDLARHLGREQPFYALRARPLETWTDAPVTIEEMATEYVHALRAAQPFGPYQIGGWSSGGLLAFEMARQLRRAGQEVSLLALLDTWVAHGRVEPSDDALLLAEIARHHARQNGKILELDAESLRGLSPSQQLSRVVEEIRGAGLVSEDIEDEWLKGFVRGLKQSRRAEQLYAPQMYDGRITLYRATDGDEDGRAELAASGFDVEDRTQGWGRFCEQVEVAEVSGHHDVMVYEPHVRTLAARMTDCIERKVTEEVYNY
jgi:amino acid adenylation domain-containing protein